MTAADRRALIEGHLPLVLAIAVKMAVQHPAFEADDLAGAGTIGLCGAAKRFSPGRGATFATFAWHRICGAMLDWMRTAGPYSRGQVKSWRADEPVVFVGLDVIAELPDGAAPVDEQLADRRGSEAVARRLEFLPPLARAVVEATWFEGLDLTRAAQQVGIGKSWASRVRAQAIRELQEAA